MSLESVFESDSARSPGHREPQVQTPGAPGGTGAEPRSPSQRAPSGQTAGAPAGTGPEPVEGSSAGRGRPRRGPGQRGPQGQIEGAPAGDRPARPGPGPLEPFCITIDGSAYSGYHRFAHRVDYYLRPFLTERNAYYETVHVEDAPLIGAAAAALTDGTDGCGS